MLPLVAIAALCCHAAAAQPLRGLAPLTNRAARSLQQGATTTIDAAGIESAVERLLAFHIPDMSTPTLTGVDADGGNLESTRNPVAWVHAALLIGLKDWARISGDEAWWEWLAVRL